MLDLNNKGEKVLRITLFLEKQLWNMFGNMSTLGLYTKGHNPFDGDTKRLGSHRRMKTLGGARVTMSQLVAICYHYYAHTCVCVTLN